MSKTLDLLMKFTDSWVAKRPRLAPDQLHPDVKVISHRGERSLQQNSGNPKQRRKNFLIKQPDNTNNTQEISNRIILENTFAAFDPLIAYNERVLRGCSGQNKPSHKTLSDSKQYATTVWGIECDIRWTKDLQPVIFHDPTLERIFGVNKNLNEYNFDDLREQFPDIPHLAELVTRYGKKLHLMLEIKSEIYPDQTLQNDRLMQALGDLKPNSHYHLYSFDTHLLDQIQTIPQQAKVAIALLNRSETLKHVLENNYAGMGAHYTVLNAASIALLQSANKKVGIGMIDSKRSLYRECHRNVEWLFSNRAIETAEQLTKLKQSLSH